MNHRGINNGKNISTSSITVKKVPQKYYNLKIELSKIFPTRAFEKHSRFMNNLQLDAFNNSLDIMYSCNRSTKLRDFQFRLIHMSLVTNKEAFHYFKKVPSDRCTFCKHNQEDIHHILLHCRYSKSLWDDLNHFLFRKTGTAVSLGDADKIFGNKLLPFSDLYNHLIILTKQYLYACRCLGDTPDINTLIRKIDREYRIELSAYNYDSNLPKSDPKIKWGPLYPP